MDELDITDERELSLFTQSVGEDEIDALEEARLL